MATPLKIGIIGSGGIAQNAHMPGYRSIPDLCEIVAVSDVNPETAKKAAEAQVKNGFAEPEIYSDYTDLLADKDIDAVSVATPNKYHLGPTVDALKAGKHVLCEKPLGMNADECRQMCRAAKNAKKILQVGLNMRFSGQAQFMKKFIEDGNMGDLYFARAQALRRRGVPGWGVFIDKEQQGGGPLIDIGVHILDFTLFLMGHPKPLSATGKAWDMLGKNPKLWNSWGDYDRNKFTVEDMAVGMIKFENGVVVSLESSFMANIEGDSFTAQLFGTKAGALVPGWGEPTIYTESNQQLFDMKPKNLPNIASTHTEEVKAFVDAILNEKPSPVPGEQGLVLNAVFDAIYKSSETGKEETIDLTY